MVVGVCQIILSNEVQVALSLSSTYSSPGQQFAFLTIYSHAALAPVRIEELDGILISIPRASPVGRGPDFLSSLDVIGDDVELADTLDSVLGWTLGCKLEVKNTVEVDE